MWLLKWWCSGIRNFCYKRNSNYNKISRKILVTSSKSWVVLGWVLWPLTFCFAFLTSSLSLRFSCRLEACRQEHLGNDTLARMLTRTCPPTHQLCNSSQGMVKVLIDCRRCRNIPAQTVQDAKLCALVNVPPKPQGMLLLSWGNPLPVSGLHPLQPLSVKAFCCPKGFSSLMTKCPGPSCDTAQVCNLLPDCWVRASRKTCDKVSMEQRKVKIRILVWDC